MAHFMIGNDFSLPGVDQAILLFKTGHDPFNRLFKLSHARFFLAAAHRQQRSFIDQIGKVSADHARGHRGQLPEIQIFFHLNVLQVDFQNFFTALFVRPIHQDVAVKASGPQQRRIQYFGPVGGRQQDNTDVGIKTIHLHQELIQRLLAFIVTAHGSDPSGLSKRIQLIDENDTGGFFGGLLEEISYPRGPQAHKHFHKLRAAHAEKRHPAFTGHGLGQHGFAGSRRADQQSPSGYFPPQVGVFARFFQELHHFHQFLFGLINTGHIRKPDLNIFLHINLGFVFAEGHKARLLSGHTLH